MMIQKHSINSPKAIPVGGSILHNLGSLSAKGSILMEGEHFNINKTHSNVNNLGNRNSVMPGPHLKLINDRFIGNDTSRKSMISPGNPKKHFSRQNLD